MFNYMFDTHVTSLTFSWLFSTPIGANRLPIVPTDSSAARIPLSNAAMALAVAMSSASNWPCSDVLVYSDAYVIVLMRCCLNSSLYFLSLLNLLRIRETDNDLEYPRGKTSTDAFAVSRNWENQTWVLCAKALKVARALRTIAFASERNLVCPTIGNRAVNSTHYFCNLIMSNTTYHFVIYFTRFRLVN